MKKKIRTVMLWNMVGQYPSIAINRAARTNIHTDAGKPVGIAKIQTDILNGKARMTISFVAKGMKEFPSDCTSRRIHGALGSCSEKLAKYDFFVGGSALGSLAGLYHGPLLLAYVSFKPLNGRSITNAAFDVFWEIYRTFNADRNALFNPLIYQETMVLHGNHWIRFGDYAAWSYAQNV